MKSNKQSRIKKIKYFFVALEKMRGIKRKKNAEIHFENIGGILGRSDGNCKARNFFSTSSVSDRRLK